MGSGTCLRLLWLLAALGECFKVVERGKKVLGKPLNVACFFNGDTEKLLVDRRPLYVLPLGDVGLEDVLGGVLGHANERRDAIETGRLRFVTY